MKKLFEYLLVIALLSPLLFINIRDSHDWGDDFAGYLRQAKNISEGKPFYQSKFEYHDYNPGYAPPYYSYGFPLLLAPVVKVWGLNFKMLDRYMSLWALAWALLIFGYLRRNFSLFASLSFILLFFLNPYFFDLKTNILSDVPFSFFFLWLLMLYQRRKGKPIYYLILTGLVFAFMIGIRSMGMIVLPVILLDLGFKCVRFVLNKISREEIKKEITETATILFSAAIFFFIFNHVLFKTPADQTMHFIGLFRNGEYKEVILKNLDVYTTYFNDLFHHEVGQYYFVKRYSSSFMLVLLVIGFINSIFSKYKFGIVVIVIFCTVVVLFPFSNQGFRYLLPVLPLLIFCIILGAKSIRIAPGWNKTFVAVVFVMFNLLQYRYDIATFRRNQSNTIWPGPFIEDNRTAFDHIRNDIPDTALIACLKPRALELFTDKRTCVLPQDNDVPAAAVKLNIAKPTYLLSIKDLGRKVDEVAAYRKDSLIWENNACRLYLCTGNQKKK